MNVTKEASPETTQDPVIDPSEPAPAPRPGSRPGRGVLAAGAAGIGLVLIGLGLVAANRSGDAIALSAGANVAVNQDAGSLEAHNSPALVVSPTNPRLVVVAGRIDRLRFSAGLHVSRDGGTTWSDVPLNVPAGQDRPYAPDVAFDSRGNLVVLFATLQGPANTPGALWVERSTDGAATFSQPVQVTGAFAFQPRLALAPTSGAVHVTWLQGTPAAETVPEGLGPPPNPVVMATSTDGGATFGAPVQVSEPSRLRVGAATPLVGPTGDVFVLYEDFGDDAADFEGQPVTVHSGRFSLVLARSGDAGKTFQSASVVEPNVVPSEPVRVYSPRFPSLAIDAENGTLYAVWSDARNGDWDVFLRRSDDSGVSWSDPVRVNDDKVRSGAHQYLPTVAVAPDGGVHVLYLDRRDDPGNALAAAYLSSSFDKGEGWDSMALSDVLFDSRVGPGSERQATDPGSRLGLAATEDTLYAAWTDTRRGSLDTDKQDLFFAPVTVGSE